MLLHPHLAHSSTTNVRFGRDVRLALTKRAYWTGRDRTIFCGILDEHDPNDSFQLQVCFFLPLLRTCDLTLKHIEPSCARTSFFNLLATGPAISNCSPVELPLSWATTERTRCPESVLEMADVFRPVFLVPKVPSALSHKI